MKLLHEQEYELVFLSLRSTPKASRPSRLDEVFRSALVFITDQLSA